MSEEEINKEEVKEIICNGLNEENPINFYENANKEWFNEFKDKWDKVDKRLTKIEKGKGKGAFFITLKQYTLKNFKENFDIEVKDILKSECCKSGLTALYLREFNLHCFFCNKCNKLSFVILKKWMMGIKQKPHK